MEQQESKSQSPATLVAILVAAKRAGDRDLESYARHELEQRHRMRISFMRPTREKVGGK